MARLLFTQAARADLVGAVSWYDSHAPHVVPQFRDALRSALIRIAEHPKQFPPAYKTHVALCYVGSLTLSYFEN
ncbi:type II toxin-antitoxin system RelE/ParE family toxin [Bradyrhizobium sp. ERR14]|uniref:type II toxin-antitoxin system RelE/ParE family toxin n=1 Tax=Bradyrhizobium sp. ERR14 TaxID=2663837 RepID=UPI00161695E3|nr:type II toxin-antitoxin system RelE/ParE family toxin [Bradyrhizobium sp. ERR14]MBB4393317.1 plasmid stabilization system protein ParE [Bradyrhizobium sp. ERR14]